jgi:hypothetical protein
MQIGTLSTRTGLRAALAQRLAQTPETGASCPRRPPP